MLGVCECARCIDLGILFARVGRNAKRLEGLKPLCCFECTSGSATRKIMKLLSVKMQATFRRFFISLQEGSFFCS